MSPVEYTKGDPGGEEALGRGSEAATMAKAKDIRAAGARRDKGSRFSRDPWGEHSACHPDLRPRASRTDRGRISIV